MPVAQDTRAAVIARINRLEGQVSGLRRMMEQDRPCEEVLRQVSAVSGAAKALWRHIMETHLSQCLARGDSDEQTARQTLEAFLKALDQF